MKSKRVPPADLETIMPLLIGVWRRFRKLAGPPDVLQTREFRSVVQAVQTLQKGLETGQALHGKDYFTDPELLGAYLLYQWVVHYQQGLSLINEVPFTPRRILEVCSGPAPFAFAALRHGASEAIAVDRNLTAMQLGAEVCGRYGMPLTLRRLDCLKGPLSVEGTFDLIIVPHCLEELFPLSQPRWEEAQLQFIQQLLNKLTPHGCLLVVESSLLPANRRVLSLRDTLVQQGLSVQAPCVWKGACPSLQTPNSPCYAQREFEKPYVIKEIQRAAQINLNSLKMTYLLFRSPAAEWPQLPADPLYRVISPSFETYHGKRYYLCGTDGKKILESNLKSHPAEARAFDYLKRGELIEIQHAQAKSHGLEIVEGTQIRVEAALGKPLLEKEIQES